MTEYSDEALKDYVKYLFESHSRDIENLTVWEVAEDFFTERLSDEQFDRIFQLLSDADVELVVTWNG